MQQNQQINERRIYFKWARTVNTVYLIVNPEWTLEIFIQYVKNKVNDQNIELVKTMQSTDTMDAEDADAVESSTLVTVYQKFRNDWINNYLAFYIRKISSSSSSSSPISSSPILSSSPISSSPISSSPILSSTENRNIVVQLLSRARVEEEEEEEEVVVRECIICYESFPITDYTPYGCQHFACLVCVKECIRTNNNKCSICKLL